MNTLSGVSNPGSVTGTGFTTPIDPIAPAPSVDTSVSATVVPDSAPLYQGFLPFSLSTTGLGLRSPMNAGDTTALIGEISLQLEQSAAVARNNQAATQASGRRDSILDLAQSALSAFNLARKIKSTKLERSQVESEKVVLNVTLAAQQRDRGDEAGKLDTVNTQIAQVDTSIATLDTAIAAATDPNVKASLEAQRSGLVSQRATLVDSKTAIEAKIATLDADIATTKTRIAEAEAKIATLTQSIAKDTNLMNFFNFIMFLGFLGITTFLRAGVEAQDGQNMDRDQLVSIRFEDNFANDVEINQILDELARSLDIQMDKTQQVTDNRAVMLTALTMSEAITNALALLQSLTPLDDDLTDAALMQGGRLRVAV